MRTLFFLHFYILNPSGQIGGATGDDHFRMECECDPFDHVKVGRGNADVLGWRAEGWRDRCPVIRDQETNAYTDWNFRRDHG